MKTPRLIQSLLRPVLLASLLAPAARADQPPDWLLLPSAQVLSPGIYLDQILAPPATTPFAAPAVPADAAPATAVPASAVLPHIRLAPAPAFGQTASLSSTQLLTLVRQQAPDFIGTNWSGASQIRVTRRTRLLGEPELKSMLTSALQTEQVKDLGELELRFPRAWTPIPVPDEPLALKITELPASGVGPNFILRFELATADERAGTWQLAAQAKVWREVPVARSTLRRGQLLHDAEVALEKRDVLLQRDCLDKTSLTDDSLELTENVSAGATLTPRYVRVRPLILRGRLVDALVQDGALSISLKVEVLEDALPGQTVRIRNPKTRREFYGKVQNEQTVVVAL